MPENTRPLSTKPQDSEEQEDMQICCCLIGRGGEQRSVDIPKATF